MLANDQGYNALLYFGEEGVRCNRYDPHRSCSLISGFRIPDSGFLFLVPNCGFRFPGFRAALVYAIVFGLVQASLILHVDLISCRYFYNTLNVSSYWCDLYVCDNMLHISATWHKLLMSKREVELQLSRNGKRSNDWLTTIEPK